VFTARRFIPSVPRHGLEDRVPGEVAIGDDQLEDRPVGVGQEARVVRDVLDRGVDLVRQPGRQPAERLQLLSVLDLYLAGQTLTDVGHHADQSVPVTPLVDHRSADDLHREVTPEEPLQPALEGVRGSAGLDPVQPGGDLFAIVGVHEGLQREPDAADDT
jgi:hypothetical protein